MIAKSPSEIAITYDKSEFGGAVELQRRLTHFNFSSTLLNPFKSQGGEVIEDIIDERYDALRGVGAGALLVMTRELQPTTFDPSLPDYLMADIEAAAALCEEEGLYTSIHISYPVANYGTSAERLNQLGVRSREVNMFKHLKKIKERQWIK